VDHQKIHGRSSALMMIGGNASLSHVSKPETIAVVSIVSLVRAMAGKMMRSKRSGVT
jgi:hypothetical protein